MVNTLKTIWASDEDWKKARELGLNIAQIFRESLKKAIQQKESEVKELEEFKAQKNERVS